MPTHPRSYSPSAAEKLRLALLALAASATVAASAQDVPDDDPAETDVLGEIPEDIEEGGVYVCNPCEKTSCVSDDCLCEGECTEEKPCDGCDTPSSAEEKTHAENAESAETQSHAESAEGAESESHAENAESAESAPETVVRGEAPAMPVRFSTNDPALPPLPIELTEADLKRLEAAGFDVAAAIHAATNAAARATGTTNAPAALRPFRTGGVILSVPRTNP